MSAYIFNPLGVSKRIQIQNRWHFGDNNHVTFCLQDSIQLKELLQDEEGGQNFVFSISWENVVFA